MGKIEQVRACLLNPFVDYPQLNEQERRVLRLASRGYTNKSIASNQGISDDMVAYLLRNGLLKLNVNKKDLPNIVFATIEKIVA